MASGDEDGGPAFPTSVNTPSGYEHRTGLTIRDWFAGQALSGLLADGDYTELEAAADDSYRVASAMLEARK